MTQSRAKSGDWRCLLSILTLLMAAVDSAASATVNIVGLGATPCATFVIEIERSPALQRDYFAWAQGFMSGVLIRAPTGIDQDLNLNPPAFALNQQVEFLREFCSTNPDRDYNDGVLELYRVLRGKQRTP